MTQGGARGLASMLKFRVHEVSPPQLTVSSSKGSAGEEDARESCGVLKLKGTLTINLQSVAGGRRLFGKALSIIAMQTASENLQPQGKLFVCAGVGKLVTSVHPLCGGGGAHSLIWSHGLSIIHLDFR